MGLAAGAGRVAPPRVAGAIHGRPHDRRTAKAEAAGGRRQEAVGPLPRAAGAAGEVGAKAARDAVYVPWGMGRRQITVVLHPRLLASVGPLEGAGAADAAGRPRLSPLVAHRLGDPTTERGRLQGVDRLHCGAHGVGDMKCIHG